MNFRIGAFIAMSFMLLAAAGQQHPAGASGSKTIKDDGVPQFTAKNELLRPKNYREWIFVGSSLGLGYDGGKKPAKGASQPLGHFKHIYINRLGYRAFRNTGKFPVGTMLILEGVSRGEKTNPQLRGYFSNRFGGIEAAVKTGDRFDDPWNYFGFTKNVKQQTKAKRITNKSCIRCHRKHAKTDHVFTQFYPVLEAVRPKK